MKILIEKPAEKIRKRFIHHFVNTELEYYSAQINELHSFKDGLCYTGYLWDCFKNCAVKSEEYCMKYIQNKDEFYVMWDIHSCERILIPNYWKYPKEAVLLVHSSEFNKIVHSLPEDIYLFDKKFTWCIAFTHEESILNERYCLLAMSERES
ncbi:MAG: hypothetical protein ACI4GB_08135 [Acutalibacteraceae bacterium]